MISGMHSAKAKLRKIARVILDVWQLPAEQQSAEPGAFL
jgi:hypothetical protein